MSTALFPTASGGSAAGWRPDGRGLGTHIDGDKVLSDLDEFAIDGTNLPVFDLGSYMKDPDSAESLRECKHMAACLRDTGVLVVRDPRATVEDSDRFIDMMERYFGQDSEAKMPEARPELHYQVGVTPELVEVPRCTVDPSCLKVIEEQTEENKATVPKGPDPKWRYFWRMGERPDPSKTKFAELNAPPVVPKAFPEWNQVMDCWGNKMLSAVGVVAEMSAKGFDLPKETFTDCMHCGPHLLAPTGSDLAKYNKPKTVFAGYHYDLNFLTIHGKSRFPGLFIWLRDGRKVPVKMPDGCLLLQAGKQLEWLTGGFVQAGFHEVIYTEATKGAVEQKTKDGKSLWRVSSTLFAHVASDVTLKPLAHFAKQKAVEKYPRVLCGDYVNSELEAIMLKA